MSSTTSAESTPPTSLLFSGVARLASSLLRRDEGTLTPPPGMDVVSFSAQMCAASRAIEHAQPPELRLFKDPYAEVLAGPEAMQRSRSRLLRQFDDLNTPRRPRIAIRTRYFDDFANSALHRFAPNLAQLVSLAAGLETRAYRLDELSPSVSYFEVDSAHVLLRKKKILEQIDPPPVLLAGSHTSVVANLAEPGLQNRLELAGFDPAVRTIWLLEGLCYYLEKDRVRDLQEEICRISPVGSCVCLSALSKLKRDPSRRSGLVSYFLSAMENPQEVLESAGWELDAVDQIGGPNANYGRWDLDGPIGPDDWKNEGATIYVTGTKRE